MVMEKEALADRREYQDRLAEAKRKGLPAAAVGDGSMAEQQICQEVQQLLQQQFSQQGTAYCQLRPIHQEELLAANEKTEEAQLQVQQLQNKVSQFLNFP